MTNSNSLLSLLPNPIFVSRTLLCGVLSLAAIALASFPDTALGQPAIYNVGAPDGGSYSGAYGVSGSGSAVAVTVDLFGSARAYRWTLRKPPLNLGSLDGAYGNAVNSISRDGSALVGVSFLPDDSARAWLWTAEDGLRDLGLVPDSVGAVANGVSRNGRVVVGDTFNADFMRQAFRWTEETGLQSIGIFPGGTYSGAQAVSDDGSTVVGQADSSGVDRAYRWTARTGMQLLPLLSPTDPMSNGFGVNQNGSVIAGFSGTHAVIWVKGGVRDLGILPGDNNTVAYAVNAEGTVVGGYSFQGFNVRAILWTKASGFIDLKTYLTTLGINLTGWQLQYTRGVSNDGRTIVGEGTYNGEYRGWVVKLGPVFDRDDDDDDDHGHGHGRDGGKGRGNNRR